MGETWVMVIIMSIAGGKSPLSGTGILRLFRLLRLSRLVRMLRSLPELMILIKGMMTAMKAVMYVMCLLVIFTYVFAIAFTQLAVNTPTIGDTYFANIGFSMYSLCIYATFLDDLSNMMDDERADKWWLVFISLVFICLASMTVLNMLIGVLCEVVSRVAKVEKEEMTTLAVTEKMLKVATELDTKGNKNNKIDYEEFAKIVENPEALRALDEVGVNPVGIVEFAGLFFFENEKPIELSFEDFMEMVLDLREENKATVKDVIDLWRRIKDTAYRDICDIHKKTEDLNKSQDNKFKEMDSQVDDLLKAAQKLAYRA